MLETIKNGFCAIIDILTTLFDFVIDIIYSTINLFLQLPDIIKTLTAAIGLLPSVLLSACIFCVTVRVIVQVAHTKAGE